ncbi:MAG: divalent-cation tolerance protein CutA [Kiritimatiellaceae bacterium]|jgi:periplasmic divalent cation tolerance protein|nr:divalent-cation tolerance protein CutA [Kiritimatiellaceae bacterium]|tara:strand:- start:466 stop:801 length:336 start_codon:yes stop_codon:yes gene_type:complete
MAESLELSVEWVYVTAGSEEEAVLLARTLVMEKYAACANILGPIRSFYRWNNEVREDAEVALVFKTTREMLPVCKQRLIELHSYSCPCVLSFSATGGTDAFLNWVKLQLLN